jgi:hypothetical protein
MCVRWGWELPGPTVSAPTRETNEFTPSFDKLPLDEEELDDFGDSAIRRGSAAEETSLTARSHEPPNSELEK